MTINLLFSIDDHYFQQIKTTLWSIKQNSAPRQQYDVYVLQHPALSSNQELDQFCR